MKNPLTKAFYIGVLCFGISCASVKIALDYGYGTADAPTVDVGTQKLLGKNLNVVRFANGDLIPEARTDEEWKRAGQNKQPAWCYYENDPSNGRIYGRLYNWYAVKDRRGLAPRGWHIPSDAEWTALTDFLGGGTHAGLKMKSTSGWDKNGNGNNSSGFSGLPGGYRCTYASDGTFQDLGKVCFCWSSTENPEGAPDFDGGLSLKIKTSALCLWLAYNDGEASMNNPNKSDGISVRCVEDK